MRDELGPTSALLAALDLPQEALVDIRLTKKQLLAQGAPTAAEKRQVKEGLETAHWVASLKPQTVGLAGFADEETDYGELAVVALETKGAADGDRLERLVHRTIPYPVLLIVECDGELAVSVALKRRSLAERDRFVLAGDGEVMSVAWEEPASDPVWHDFLKELAITRGHTKDLRAVYLSWLNAIVAVRATRQGEPFVVPSDETKAADRVDALREVERLSVEIARTRKAAEKASQKRRQVELNVKLAELRSAYRAAVERVMIAPS